MRRSAANTLGSSYSLIPEEFKKQAWDDLIRLTQDDNSDVRINAVAVLGDCYPKIPEEFKKQAWSDLIRLTKDNYYFVRRSATRALGGCYSQIPAEYKIQAWGDLHRLMRDYNDSVRSGAAGVLGDCYSQIPAEYKKQAWDDLHGLTQDKYNNVRVTANHSSGRVSIYRASQAKGDESVRKELETALKFFEKASNESTYSNPAKFCLPFYRSFYTITFRKEDAEDEVKKYLTEAKKAVEGSKSKEKLLEAVENLGNALKEVHRVRDSNEIKSDLNTYLRYCDRACELIDTTEENASGASRLIRKGLPIIDERIKGIIGEIKEKTKTLCKQTQDTQFADLGNKLNKAGQILSKVGNPIALDKTIDNMQIVLSAICAKMPEEEKGEACELLKQAKDEPYVEDRINLTNMVLSKISTQMNIVSAQISVEKKQDEMLARISQLSGVTERIDAKTDIVIEYVKKIETSCNQIIDDLEESGIKLRDEDKEELKTLAADLRSVNSEQLTNFTNELIKLLGDPKLERELEKEVPNKLVTKTFSKIIEITNELGIALSAAVTAEKILPPVEEILRDCRISAKTETSDENLISKSLCTTILKS